MKVRNVEYLKSISNVETIYAFRILGGIIYFIGWGETTSSGNFRKFSSAFPVSIVKLKTEMPNDAVINSEGWESTTSCCEFNDVEDLICETVNPVVMSILVEEFQELIDKLRDDEYFFVFEDNSIKKERSNA